MWFEHELTMAVSWELLAWAMPRMLVVCITSTEKLGSQLAMRDPVRKEVDVIVTDKASRWTCLIQLKTHTWFCTTLTIKVEEVIMLVDVWSGICSSSYWAHVLLQTRALLLAPHLASVPADVQGCAAGGTRGVLFQPWSQTWTEKTQNTFIHLLYLDVL